MARLLSISLLLGLVLVAVVVSRRGRQGPTARDVLDYEDAVARARQDDEAIKQQLTVQRAEGDLPEIRIQGATALLTFGPWRWKDAAKTQLVAPMTLAEGSLYRLDITFFEGETVLAEDHLPGNIFERVGQTQTRYLPGPTMMWADGRIDRDRIADATLVVVDILAAETTGLLAGQSRWVQQKAAGCERASILDCEALIAALRDGDASNQVAPDPVLARYYSQRMVEVGEASCDGGEMWSCFLLGVAFYYGGEVAQDEARGRALVRRACEDGLDEACTWETENLPSR